MKRKKNLIVSAITCMFSICLMMFGVYAATNPSVNLSGQVSYSVHDARVLVQGKMHGADGYLTDVGYPAVADVQNPGAKINTTNQYLDYTTGSGFGDAVDDFEAWNLGSDLKFFEDNDGIKTIQLSFQFTNLSNYPVKVKLVDNTTVSTNVSMTKSSESVILQNGTSGNSGELTISMNVIDDSKSANLTFDFEFEIAKYQIELWTSEFYDSNNNSLRIVGYNGTGAETQVVIPATVQKDGVSYPVKAIGLAIDNENDVTGSEQPLFAPKVLTEGVFNTTLTNVIVSEGITEIGGGAFAGCQNLVGVTLPKNVTKIGLLSFAYTGLQRFEIPNTVTSVGISAFEGCSSLKTLVIPSSVSKIGDYAFTGCSALETISVEQEVVANVACGTNAFGSASDRTFKIYVPNIDYKTATNWSSYKDYMIVGNAVLSEETIGDWKVEICSGNTANIVKYLGDITKETVTVPANIEFEGKTYKVISVGDTTKYSDDEDFQSNANPLYRDYLGIVSDILFNEKYDDLPKVKRLVISDGIANIGAAAFVGWVGLESISFPQNMDSISRSAFAFCGLLRSESVSLDIKIPNGITEISESAFAYMGINNLELPSGLKTVGESAFSNSLFSSLILPETLETIGKDAFNTCKNLTEIVIGKNVTSLGDTAFAHCTSLISVTFESETPPQMNSNAPFHECSNIENIYVPSTSVEIYKAKYGTTNTLYSKVKAK